MSIKSWLFGFLVKTPEFDIHAPSAKSEEESIQQAKDAIELVKERVKKEEELKKIEEEGMNAFKDLHSMMDKMNEMDEEDWGEKVDEDGKTKK